MIKLKITLPFQVHSTSFQCHFCTVRLMCHTLACVGFLLLPQIKLNNVYITLSVCKILFLRKHLYLYDGLNWQHYVYRSSWSIISHWKEEKYIDNYRCYEEEAISSFVLNQLDELNPKQDTVAAIFSLIFTVSILEAATQIDDLHPWHFQINLVS